MLYNVFTFITSRLINSVARVVAVDAVREADRLGADLEDSEESAEVLRACLQFSARQVANANSALARANVGAGFVDTSTTALYSYANIAGFVGVAIAVVAAGCGIYYYYTRTVPVVGSGAELRDSVVTSNVVDTTSAVTSVDSGSAVTSVVRDSIADVSSTTASVSGDTAVNAASNLVSSCGLVVCGAVLALVGVYYIYRGVRRNA